MKANTGWSTQGDTVVHACSACGQKNRVPPERLAAKGKCGKCSAELPPLDQPLDVDQPLFDAIVARSKAPVLVDFWAAWCGPCRMAAPQVEKAAKNTSGRAVALKVDTEQNPALAERYGIRGIPHFMVCMDGGPVFQQSGVVDASQLEGWLARAARDRRVA